MKTNYVQTLCPYTAGKLLAIDPKGSDCIEIADSEAFDVKLLAKMLQGQAKHGCLGESLASLFLETKGDRTVLLMREDRANPDWLKQYQAVYWFVCGWGDAQFSIARAKGGAA